MGLGLIHGLGQHAPRWTPTLFITPILDQVAEVTSSCAWVRRYWVPVSRARGHPIRLSI